MLDFLPSNETEENRLGRQYVGPYKYEADTLSSLSARVESGINNSTGAVLMDRLMRPSVGEEPLLSMNELFQKFPNEMWTEPTTERQAEWRWRRNNTTRMSRDVIDKREQGVTATVLGFGAELVTGALLSPETYVAPIAGRLSVTAGRMLLANGGKAGSLVKAAASAQSKNYFMLGFAEDAFLTGAISEPLYGSREELLGNPQKAMDYWGAVLLSGTFSGLMNSGASRLLDRAQFNAEVKHNSRKLIETLTGVPDRVLSPRDMAKVKKEAKLATHIGQWLGRSQHEGHVRIYEDLQNPAAPSVHPETGDITINTANIKHPDQLREALNEALTNPDANPHKARVSMTENGTVEAPNTRWKKPVVSTHTTSPHTKYNLSNPEPGILEISRVRMKEQVQQIWEQSPEEVSTKYIDDTFASEDITFSVPEATDKLDNYRLDAHAENSKTTLEKFSEKAKALNKILLRVAGSEQARYWKVLKDLKDPLILGDEVSLNRVLAEAGITRNEFKNTNPQDLADRFKTEYKERVMNRVHNDILTQELGDFWYESAGDGIGALHERLSGSLEPGVTDRTGHGNSVWRRQEIERSHYANIVHTALIESGLERYVRKYDDEAASFFVEVERSLNKMPTTNKEAQKFAEVIGEVFENQRGRLNMNGAGVRQLPGFFLRTTHNSELIAGNKAGWMDMMSRGDSLDWARMGRGADSEAQRRVYLESVYKDILEGHPRDTDLDLEINGGYKGKTFAHARQIHFKPGKQTLYNDAFGRSNTMRQLLDQIELRAKAIAITDTMGPNFKNTWTRVQARLVADNVPLESIGRFKAQFDEITGEANSVVDQRVAAYSNNFTNSVNAVVLSGTGITVGLSDPVSQVVHMRSSGLTQSLGQATRAVFDSYGPAVRAILKNNPNASEQRIMAMVLPHDTNLLQASRRVLGDNSYGSTGAGGFGGWIERLSQAVIKWSGTGVFTKVSQMSTAIATQRNLARMFVEGVEDADFKTYLKRFNISDKEFAAASKHILGDQLDIFSIEPAALRDKFRNLLSEAIGVGSLQSDPRQASAFHGLPRLIGESGKKGTIPRAISDGATQYLPAALAVHQKLLLRMAIMGGGDARFMSLLDRSRIAETATVAGMMLGSAIAITTVKDILRNKEPAWAGDKPLDPEYLSRVLKVSGIAPLLTESMDTLRGGMAGQMIGQGLQVGKAAGEGDAWETFHQAKRLSPFWQTQIGPAPTILESLIGTVADEYSRDIAAKHRNVQIMSGQGRLFE